MECSEFARHNMKVQAYINNMKIDTNLVAETHFTNHRHIKIPWYKIDKRIHSSEKVIIKNGIKHYKLSP